LSSEEGITSPLIVVIDSDGPYILEGATRIDAIYNLGIKTFPALVVIDKEDSQNNIVQTANSKQAQTYQENFYTLDIAKNPETNPEILTKILERGKNDDVSIYAAGNPNCPPEALTMVIQRGKNDSVSCYAAENPNCPPETLKMVLERGKNDDVSYYAVRNPNCQPEALTMVLQRGKNDNVSYWASRNPNCPSIALIEWMQATGKIKQEPQEEPKIDPDLEQLKSLISSSHNWYKQANQNQPIPN